MGSSRYSVDDYAARVSYRSATHTPTFAYSADISSGVVAAKVHTSLNPFNVVREARDSDAHPVTLPIGVILDTTGSMAHVPSIVQGKLNQLMGTFLNDKASGKAYLGDAYPAILIGAISDYYSQASYDHEGTLQVGQFESGIEIDDNLTNLWLTGGGGGTYEESYEAAMYFFLHKTVTDAWEKRGQKGILFFIGDEHPYPNVEPKVISKVIGDSLQGPISTASLVAQLREKWEVFFILPKMTSHYGDHSLELYWETLLGQGHVIKLEEPENVCETIATAVAMVLGNVTVDDATADGIPKSVTTALARLVSAGLVSSKFDIGTNLPATSSGHTVRL